MKQKIIFFIIGIIIGVIATTVAFTIYNNQNSSSSSESNEFGMESPDGNMPENGMPGEPGGNNSDSSSVEKIGATEITDKKTVSGENYETDEEDTSVILVKDGGVLDISDSKINKTGGDSSNTENSEFYGVNAGFLVTENSSATLKDVEITTDAKGSNAVFSTGTDSKIYISDSKITTTGSSSSRGLDATYGGYIEADNVSISTDGGSCATLATDRGEGTVIAKNSKLTTKGSGSPVIYSTGDITIENSEGEAKGSQMVVVEGKNLATVTDSILKCSGEGNRNDVDNCGIMIYQSMSGDAGEGTGSFTATNSILTIDEDSSLYKDVPFFFVTNTDAVINLENCTLEYGSGLLLSAKGTDEWGKSGSNGGNVTLNSKKQELIGDIELDDISEATINLDEKSSLKGTINSEDSAKEITVILSSDSKLTLTGNSYITTLIDDDESYSNIDLNGYKLYVDGQVLEK